MTSTTLATLFTAMLGLGSAASAATPQGTEFTYQGELRAGSSAVTGKVDMQFTLYASIAGPTQIGSTICANDTVLTGGRVTRTLDFGDVFRGQQRFLGLKVRTDPQGTRDCNDTTGYTELLPRILVTGAPVASAALSAPYATHADAADIADEADDAMTLAGIPASEFANAANKTGVLPGASLSGAYGQPITLSNPSNVLVGDGSALVGVSSNSAIVAGTAGSAGSAANAGFLNGQAPSFYRSWANRSGSLLSNIGLMPNDTFLILNPLQFTNPANAFSGVGTLLSLNASGVTAGTLGGSRLNGQYGSALSLTNPSNTITGSGAGVAGLNAGAVTAGVLAYERVIGSWHYAAMQQSASASQNTTAADIPALLTGTSGTINVPFAGVATFNWTVSGWSSAAHVAYDVLVYFDGVPFVARTPIVFNRAGVHQSNSGTFTFSMPAGTHDISLRLLRTVGSATFFCDFNDRHTWSVLVTRQ